MKEREWRAAATHAAAEATETVLQKVTAIWAAARQEYLALCDSEDPSVPALRKAACRLSELERRRLELARQLQRAV
jgi:hypothetical protein